LAQINFDSGCLLKQNRRSLVTAPNGHEETPGRTTSPDQGETRGEGDEVVPPPMTVVPIGELGPSTEEREVMMRLEAVGQEEVLLTKAAVLRAHARKCNCEEDMKQVPMFLGGL
jgi:hypothetical protein